MAEKKVLVVEDDDSLRETLVDILRHKDIPVIEAGSGQEGWEAYQANKADIGLIITDCHMVGVPTAGIDLARKIRADNKKVKIALHTTETPEVTQGIAGLNVTLIKKPEPELFAIIDFLLGRDAPVAAPSPAGGWAARETGKGDIQKS